MWNRTKPILGSQGRVVGGPRRSRGRVEAHSTLSREAINRCLVVTGGTVPFIHLGQQEAP